MNDTIINGVIAVMLAIVGIALAAIIFSKGGQTAQVITAGGTAFSQVIAAAVKPVS